MNASIRLVAMFTVVALLMLVVPAAAQNETVKTRLTGYQETPLTISSPASGEFSAKIHGLAIDYELSYEGLSAPITQAHIHFGRPAITGGIVLFLCTNLTPPAGVPTPQACPAPPATITGTLTSADVIAVPGQGIDSGAAGFAEILDAIRAGAAYVNVHTTAHLPGEIRGGLRLQKANNH
jgi:hypothetical protein